MKLLTKTGNIFDQVCTVLAILAGVLVIFVFAIVNSEVIIRSTTVHSISEWMIEVSEYCLLFMTFLGTTWLLRRDGHVKIELVLSRLEPRHQVVIRVFNSIICAIACLILTWYSARVTWTNFQSGFLYGGGLMPPYWIILSIIPVGSFLLSIQFMRITYGHLRNR